MKKILLPFVCAVLFAACSNDASGPDAATDTTAADALTDEEALTQDAFPQLYNNLKSQDASFDPALFAETEGGTGTPSAARFFPPEELASFKPYLVYNSDSSKAIDFVTHNYFLVKKGDATAFEPTEPANDVAIINMKDNMRTRLFTGGQATIISEGKWLDSTTILVGGAEKINDESIQPFLLRINTKDQSIQRFTYPDTVKAMIQMQQ